MLSELEKQLKVKQAEISQYPLDLATYAAAFWKRQFQELESKYNRLDAELSQCREAGLLPMEIDDGK